MSQGINGWKGRERLLWNSLCFLCPGWPLCVSLLCPIQVPSPWPFTGESMARSLSQPDATAVSLSEGSRQHSPFLDGKRGGGLCRSRVFLLSRLRISDCIARSRSQSSFLPTIHVQSPQNRDDVTSFQRVLGGVEGGSHDLWLSAFPVDK